MTAKQISSETISRLDPRTVPIFWRWVGLVALAGWIACTVGLMFIDDQAVKDLVLEIKGKLATVFIFAWLTKKTKP